MEIATYRSSLGEISIATHGNKLYGVEFGNSVQGLIPCVHLITAPPPYKIVEKVLLVIDGKTFDPKLQLSFLDSGTDFQIKVWEALREIPLGTTVSYKEIAKQIGMPTAIRAVANAVGTNPIAVIVPCHRVIRSDGSLGGYRWGEDLKRKLLNREDLVVS